jgi:hypothetical protein
MCCVPSLRPMGRLNSAPASMAVAAVSLRGRGVFRREAWVFRHVGSAACCLTLDMDEEHNTGERARKRARRRPRRREARAGAAARAGEPLAPTRRSRRPAASAAPLSLGDPSRRHADTETARPAARTPALTAPHEAVGRAAQLALEGGRRSVPRVVDDHALGPRPSTPAPTRRRAEPGDRRGRAVAAPPPRAAPRTPRCGRTSVLPRVEVGRPTFDPPGSGPAVGDRFAWRPAGLTPVGDAGSAAQWRMRERRPLTRQRPSWPRMRATRRPKPCTTRSTTGTLATLPTGSSSVSTDSDGIGGSPLVVLA